MKYHKHARLLAVLMVAALAATSLTVIAATDDSSAGSATYVNDFSGLKNALKQGDQMIIVMGSITLKESLIISEGQRIDIRSNCTLTIPKGIELCNYGSIFVAGKIVNNGDILQPGDAVDQILIPNGSFEGKLELNIPDITVVPTGSNEFQFPYHTGINDDVVNITVKTYSADPGKYTYDVKLSEGKYTVSYDNGDNKYKCETHVAGHFTIKSDTPPDAIEYVTTFEELKQFLADNPTGGEAWVNGSFEITEAITIAKNQSVELMSGQTMTISSGTIYCEGAFCNQGTLITNDHFYQKQNRWAAYYEFGTTVGKVGLSYDDISTLYRGVDEYEIRCFPTYDIFHSIELKCTPYDKEGKSFTYTSNAEPGPGEYTIEIIDNTSSFDYFIHDAGKLNLDSGISMAESNDDDNTLLYIVVGIVTALAAIILVAYLVRH